MKNLSIVIILFFNTLCQGAERVALLIGNSDYKNLTSLYGYPINDAKDVASTLERLGFDVTVETDLDFLAMRRAIVDFRRNKISPQTELALLFYAGHGTEYQHKNYLLPVNISLDKCEEIEAGAMGVDFVLENLAKGGAKTTAIVFDACRNMPSGCTRSGENSMSYQQYNYPNTLVAYSTRSGDKAGNSSGRNSPYTTELLKALNTPNLSLFSVFNKIKMPMQQPALSISGNISEIVLNPDTGKTAQNETGNSQPVINSINKTIGYLKQEQIMLLDLQHRECKDYDATYENAVRGMVKLHAYYYALSMDVFGYSSYGSERPVNAHYEETIDFIVRRVSTALLKSNMHQVVNFLSDADKVELRAFIVQLINAYEVFVNKMPQIEKSKIKQKIKFGDWLNADDFYRIGFPSLFACNTGSISADISGASLFSTIDQTYFNYSSLDFYLYSFWLRRYLAGTMRQIKELAEYGQTILN